MVALDEYDADMCIGVRQAAYSNQVLKCCGMQNRVTVSTSSSTHSFVFDQSQWQLTFFLQHLQSSLLILIAQRPLQMLNAILIYHDY